jgi:hypothetical protein
MEIITKKFKEYSPIRTLKINSIICILISKYIRGNNGQLIQFLGGDVVIKKSACFNGYGLREKSDIGDDKKDSV